MENKKINVSMRINSHDLERVGRISGRLHVKDSDIFRFAIRLALNYLSPLDDHNVRGEKLIPSLIKCGPELVNYFDFDAHQLEIIINGGLSGDEGAVDKEDIDLMVNAQSHESIVFVKLHDFVQKMQEPMGASTLLQKYLSDKYLTKGRVQELAISYSKQPA